MDRENQEERLRQLEEEAQRLRRSLQEGQSPRPQGPRTAGPLVSGMVLVGVVGVGALIWSEVKEHLKGTVQSQSEVLGNWSGELRECTSGDANAPAFLGADLFFEGASTHQVRVLPGKKKERKLLVFIPDPDETRALTLGAEECSTLEIEAAWSGTEINDVDAVNGSVRATCTIPGGGTFTIDATFENCH